MIHLQEQRENILSNDIALGSEISPCKNIDKPLVVYSLFVFWKRYDVYNNVAYIMTKLKCFMAEMRFQSNLNVI